MAEGFIQLVAIPAVSSFIGAGFVFIFGIRQGTLQRRAAYREKQLAEFYAPILAQHARIDATMRVRKALYNGAHEAWAELCKRYEGAHQLMHDHEEQFKPYKKLFEYDNEQFTKALFPLYQKMLELFTEKYWLADEDTRNHYPAFLHYVEIWERFLSESVPRDALERVDHGADRVEAFFRHVEQKVSELQGELKARRFSVFPLRRNAEGEKILDEEHLPKT